MPDSAYAAIALASAGPTRLNWGILSSSPCTRFQCAATAAGTRHTVRSLGSNTSALDKPSAPSRISAVPGAHLANTCMSAAAAHSWISRVVRSSCSLLPEPLLIQVLVHRLSVVYITRSPRSKCCDHKRSASRKRGKFPEIRTSILHLLLPRPRKADWSRVRVIRGATTCCGSVPKNFVIACARITEKLDSLRRR